MTEKTTNTSYRENALVPSGAAARKLRATTYQPTLPTRSAVRTAASLACTRF